MNEPYEFYLKSADYVRARMPFQPELAVILGSSLGPFAAEVQNRTEIAYADIPNFPRCTVADHANLTSPPTVTRQPPHMPGAGARGLHGVLQRGAAQAVSGGAGG